MMWRKSRPNLAVRHVYDLAHFYSGTWAENQAKKSLSFHPDMGPAWRRGQAESWEYFNWTCREFADRPGRETLG